MGLRIIVAIAKLWDVVGGMRRYKMSSINSIRAIKMYIYNI
jgi:hypothetical protein